MADKKDQQRLFDLHHRELGGKLNLMAPQRRCLLVSTLDMVERPGKPAVAHRFALCSDFLLIFGVKKGLLSGAHKIKAVHPLTQMKISKVENDPTLPNAVRFSTFSGTFVAICKDAKEQRRWLKRLPQAVNLERYNERPTNPIDLDKRILGKRTSPEGKADYVQVTDEKKLAEIRAWQAERKKTTVKLPPPPEEHSTTPTSASTPPAPPALPNVEEQAEQKEQEEGEQQQTVPPPAPKPPVPTPPAPTPATAPPPAPPIGTTGPAVPPPAPLPPVPPPAPVVSPTPPAPVTAGAADTSNLMAAIRAAKGTGLRPAATKPSASPSPPSPPSGQNGLLGAIRGGIKLRHVDRSQPVAPPVEEEVEPAQQDMSTLLEKSLANYRAFVQDVSDDESDDEDWD
ncbi:MAG: hypothetical protein MHM6MM_006769 [Cercozoa sp. M6MM]